MNDNIKIILLDNIKDSLSYFNEALEIYSNEIPYNVRTDTNEIMYWFEEYNKIYKDKLMIFALLFNNKTVGFIQIVYFQNALFATIDYVVIKKEFRKYFSSFYILLLENIEKNLQKINFIVTEIDAENKVLERLAKIKGFESLGNYIQPPMSGMEDTEIIAKLLFKRIKKNETHIEKNLIIKTLYFDHYLRWYKPLLSNENYEQYKIKLSNLLFLQKC